MYGIWIHRTEPEHEDPAFISWGFTTGLVDRNWYSYFVSDRDEVLSQSSDGWTMDHVGLAGIQGF